MGKTVEDLHLTISICRALLEYAQHNDAKRRFAGIRRASKTTLNCMEDLTRYKEELADLRVKSDFSGKQVEILAGIIEDVV